MFPFAFEKEPIEQPQARMDETSLLSCLFLTMLQNERLSHQLTNTQSEEVSFSIKPQFNREQEYQLEIELKQVKIDNLTSMLRELQGQVVAGEKQLQEAVHRCATLEMNTKHEASQLKTQMLHYKAKYEEESGNGKKMAKMEVQFKKTKTELQGRNKELSTKISELQTQLLKYEKGQELQTSQLEKRVKELRMQVDMLRSDLTNKQQQCFSLKSSLDDCPKIEELNRWISKVKEYEQKQMQACSKMSQMSQQLCTCREKLRRLQNEHRELLKVKQELQATLTENKGHEDSMVIYFDRLQTYQKVIKELQEEIRKLETERKNENKQHQAKLQGLQKEKEAVVAQWKAIADEMAKQKSILTTLQKQVERYQAYIAEQNQRQKQLIRSEQASQISLQKAQQEQRMHALQEQRRRLQEMRYEPYSLIQNSKCSERSNRSFSLQNRRNDLKTETDNESIPAMHSQLYSEMSSQLRTGPASHSGIGRAISEQRIIYHSDSQNHNQSRSRNSTSRMNTQSSTGCGQCMSRVCETSNRSMALQERPLSQHRNEGVAIITDQKKLLMEKLNILKPDPSSGIRAERSISTLYNKSYRQANPTSQNFLKINPNQKQTPQQTPSTSHRLQLGRGREQKQNLNDMIVKRYANLTGRP